MGNKSTDINTRRKFLKSAGKFAVYTPPALLLMSQPSGKVFAESINETDGNNTVQTTQTTSCSGNFVEQAVARAKGYCS